MKKTAIALGFFDGIHLGHQSILRRTVEIARELDLEPIALTFDVQPRSFFIGRPGDYLITTEEKVALMKQCGIHRVEVVHFNREFAAMPARDFVVELLCRRYNAGALVCGDDYRFGAGAGGDGALLWDMAPQLGLEVAVCGPVDVRGARVSSTRVRESLQTGRIEDVTACLGRYYSVTAPVVHGKGLGHKLGFATLNLDRDPGLIRPRLGVYYGRVEMDGGSYDAAVNIGIRPSFDDGNTLSVEAHLPGFSGDVYAKTVRLDVIRFLRDECRFENVGALQAQVIRDLEEVQRLCRT